MKYIVIIVVFFFSLAMAYGQTEKICGVVADVDDRSPIAGAIVRLKNSSDVVVQYAITDDNGRFCMSHSLSDKGFSLHIQCMGYRSYTLNPEDIVTPLAVYLIPQPTQLKDVIVKAPDIEQRSDTLIYYMSKYATSQDKNMADVLRRLPGIKIEENGEIKYNGEPINKFYIDGSDFMDGRYGLATENIAPSDVAKVEILENHQPVQALQGIEFSPQAGLNVTLKKEARSQWISILNGGIGMPSPLYDASAFAMRIAGKRQNMATVRANNTGWNPASQSRIHTEDAMFDGRREDDMWEDYIVVKQLSSPIDERRTRDNFSTLANTSDSWHVADGKDVKFNLTYEYDRLDGFAWNETDYFDELISTFTECNAMQTCTHRIGSGWTLQVNRPTLFLKDNISLNAEHSHAMSDISGTMSVLQKAMANSFSVTNDLQSIKRIGSNLLSVSSRNRYTVKHQTLDVRTDKEMFQDIAAGDFRSMTEARFGKRKSRWNLYAKGGIDFNYHGMNSDLQGLKYSYPSESDMNFVLLDTYISPEASFQSYRWLLTISAPISYDLHSIGDKTVREGRTTKNYIAVTPSLYLRHQINARTDVSARLKYSLTPPKPVMQINNVFMKDFRNLYLPSSVLEYGGESSAVINFRYRNPVTSFFFHMTGKVGWAYSPRMISQQFIGNYILTGYSSTKSDSENFAVYGNVSKGLMSGKVTLGIDAGYTGVRATTMRQDVVTPYVFRVFSIHPNLKGNLTDWFSMDYRLFYANNALDIKNAGKTDYASLKQYLTLIFMPHKNWHISTGVEHYYTRFSSGSSAGLVLLDASVRWTVSSKVELSLVATNLLDKREYSYTDYGLLSETDYMYRIRGRNIVAAIQVRL